MFEPTASSEQRMDSAPPPADRATATAVQARAGECYACDVETTCKPVNAPDSLRFSARIREISRTGMRLLVSGRFGLGVF